MDCVGRVSLFFKGNRGLSIPQLYEYLKQSASEDILDTFLLVFNLRDCRGGKGEKNLGRFSLTWLMVNYPKEFRRIISLIPEYGRWDDLLYLFPRVVNLTSLEYVRSNYFSTISSSDLKEVEKTQREIVKMFANKLIQDREKMLGGKICSLAAKWAPTERDSMDRKFRLVDTLASTMKITVKDFRKKYTSPLRSYLRIVEKIMCERRWNMIDYSTIPSCAMQRLQKTFSKKDPIRFASWKKILKKGIKNIERSPHEIVKECMDNNYVYDESREKEWKEWVIKIKHFENSVIVVDTSGSMMGTPIQVAITLGSLISKCAKGVWKNCLFNFSSTPRLIKLSSTTFHDRVREIANITDWGGSLNIQAVFDLIKSECKECKECEELPERIYIVSDMEFSSAKGSHKIDWKKVNKNYRDLGCNKPQIIYWNINGSSTKEEEGVEIISGFSTDILNSILTTGTFNPYTVMRATLDGERYENIRVSFQT